jgi:hypothetical protein
LLTREDIGRAWYKGPAAMIRLLEHHLGPFALATPPTTNELEQTIKDLSQQIESLEARVRKLEDDRVREVRVGRNEGGG